MINIIKNNKRIEVLFLTIIFLFFTIILAIFIANRDVTVGEDTLNYITLYQEIIDNSDSAINELIFIFLSKFTELFNSSYQLLFFLISFISILTYISFIYLSFSVFNFEDNSKIMILTILVFGLSLFSIFYWNTQLNIIRSGLAIPFLFISLYFAYLRNKKNFIIFYILSILSHTSTIIFLPFILLLYIKNSKIMKIYLFLSFIYVTEIGEKIFFALTNLFSKLDAISYYLSYATENNEYKAGVRIDFFLFTTFFYLILYVIQKRNREFDLLFKMYSILFFPFLCIGFISYSDRLLINVWNLIPLVLISGIFYKIKLSTEYYLLAIPFLIVSTVFSLYINKLI